VFINFFLENRKRGGYFTRTMGKRVEWGKEKKISKS
jgi:hypothetical protein